MPFKDPEHRKLYNRSYHQEHKEEVNRKAKERRQTEEGKEKQQLYVIANKERLAIRNEERFTCGCGGRYTKHNKSTHEKANMHVEWLQMERFSPTE